MYISNEFAEDCKNWLVEKIEALTEDTRDVSPSQWAENNRYLPQSVTASLGTMIIPKHQPLKR